MTAVIHYFALLLMLVSLGCKRSTKDTKSYDEFIFVEGETDWMDLADLRITGEEHLRSKYPDFDSKRAEITTSVHRSTTTNMITIQYFQGFGLPVYHVQFDGRGQITHSTNRIARELIP